MTSFSSELNANRLASATLELGGHLEIYKRLAVPGLHPAETRILIGLLAGRLSAAARSLVTNRFSEESPVLLVVALRGGLLLYPSFASAFPSASLALLDIKREGDARRVQYCSLPSERRFGICIYLDVVAHTGDTVLTAHQLITEQFHIDLHIACLVCATSSATDLFLGRGLHVYGVSIREHTEEGAIRPDLGVVDAGELAVNGTAPSDRSNEEPFPSSSFHDFHRANPLAEAARVESIYRDIIGIVQGLRPSALLDVGCGSGELTRRLAEMAGRVTAVDPSEDAINLACEASCISNAYYVHGELAQLPTYMFDCTVCCMVLNSTARFEEVLLEVAKRSAPASTQIWTIPHPAFQYNATQWAAKKSITLENQTMSYSAIPSYLRMNTWVKTFGGLTLTEHHRPLSVYTAAFTRYGFRIDRLIEPAIAQECVAIGSFPDTLIPRVLTIVTSFNSPASMESTLLTT